MLVRAFWEQGKINEAVEAVNDMEQRGVVGAASVYYELACCLCNNGRWRDAMLQVCSCYMQHILHFHLSDFALSISVFQELYNFLGQYLFHEPLFCPYRSLARANLIISNFSVKRKSSLVLQLLSKSIDIKVIKSYFSAM